MTAPETPAPLPTIAVTRYDRDTFGIVRRLLHDLTFGSAIPEAPSIADIADSSLRFDEWLERADVALGTPREPGIVAEPGARACWDYLQLAIQRAGETGQTWWVTADELTASAPAGAAIQVNPDGCIATWRGLDASHRGE